MMMMGKDQITLNGMDGPLLTDTLERMMGTPQKPKQPLSPRALGEDNDDWVSYLVDSDGQAYDPYSLAWRYLGMYIDCDVDEYASYSNNNNNNNINRHRKVQQQHQHQQPQYQHQQERDLGSGSGDGECSRKVLWAAYLDPKYKGDEIGEYQFYDWTSDTWNTTTCQSRRCAKMDCHEPRSHFKLLGVYKETDGLEDWAEQLFKHEGYCVWDEDAYEFMSNYRESFPSSCNALYLSDQDGNTLYLNAKPEAEGGMSLGIYTDEYCTQESYVTFLDYVYNYVMYYYGSDERAESSVATWNNTIEYWNLYMNTYKVCQPCRAYRRYENYENDNGSGDRRRLQHGQRHRRVEDFRQYRFLGEGDDDGGGDEEKWGYNCYDDAGYRNCNQCYKFETKTDMEEATADDLRRASEQGSLLQIKYQGKVYGKGGFHTSPFNENTFQAIYLFFAVMTFVILGGIIFAYRRAGRMDEKRSSAISRSSGGGGGGKGGGGGSSSLGGRFRRFREQLNRISQDWDGDSKDSGSDATTITVDSTTREAIVLRDKRRGLPSKKSYPTEYRGHFDDLLLKSSEIKPRIRELAAVLKEDYKSSRPVLVCTLNKGSQYFFGAHVFFTRLCEALKDVRLGFDIEYINSNRASSRSSSKRKRSVLGNSSQAEALHGRQVILVEDVIRTGSGLASVTRSLHDEAAPATVEVCTLLDKRMEPSTAEIKLYEAKYIGFCIPDKFVVGYGMDFNARYRDLRDIFVLSSKRIANDKQQTGRYQGEPSTDYVSMPSDDLPMSVLKTAPQKHLPPSNLSNNDVTAKPSKDLSKDHSRSSNSKSSSRDLSNKSSKDLSSKSSQEASKEASQRSLKDSSQDSPRRQWMGVFGSSSKLSPKSSSRSEMLSSTPPLSDADDDNTNDKTNKRKTSKQGSSGALPPNTDFVQPDTNNNIIDGNSDDPPEGGDCRYSDAASSSKLPDVA